MPSGTGISICTSRFSACVYFVPTPLEHTLIWHLMRDAASYCGFMHIKLKTTKCSVVFSCICVSLTNGASGAGIAYRQYATGRTIPGSFTGRSKSRTSTPVPMPTQPTVHLGLSPRG
jgi:hypothetical protein